MDVRLANFESLRMRFYEPKHVQRAVGFLERRVGRGSDRRLRSLLRDHVSSGITVDDDTWIRDSFDFLLAYYAILEIASIAGYIGQPDANTVASARAHLEQPDVVRYYEEHYPLLLPALFRERLEGRNQLRETVRAEADQLRAQSLVMRFTQLIGARNADWDIDRFLFLMDDGEVGGVDWRSLLRPLADLDQYLSITGKSGDDDDPGAQALRGFTKFIEFCENLERLLQSAADFTLLQAAMWHYNAYWFVRIADKLGPRLEEILSMLEKWREKAGAPAVFDAELAEVQKRVHRTLGALMDRRRGQPLLEASGYVASLSRHPDDDEVTVWRFRKA